MRAPPSDQAPLRVGYVLKKYPRISETFILNEVLGLEEAGVAVTVFSLNLPDDGRFHADLARVAADVVYLPAFGSASVLAGVRALTELGVTPERLGAALDFLDRLPPEKRAGLLVQAFHLARAARDRGLDVLHAHFMTVAAHAACLAHLLCGVPFTVTAHAKDIYRDAVDPDVFATVARHASRLVTVSDDNRAWIGEHLLPGDLGKVERIYNGVALEDFGGADGRREPGLILGVGRLVEKKAFDVLLRAMRILRDRGRAVRAVVIGDGEERAALGALRGKLGLEDAVTLTGALPRADVLAWMRKASVLAAPCRIGADGNRDALPTVLIEALASGLPAVATRVGGIPEILDDGTNGIVLPSADETAFADAIERLLHDRALWERFAHAGPAKARERFDRRKTLPGLVSVFRAARTSSWIESVT